RLVPAPGRRVGGRRPGARIRPLPPATDQETTAMTAPRQAWHWLGTAASVRLITLGMVVYALAIGGLVAGYARVSACLSTYSNASARSTGERTIAAAE